MFVISATNVPCARVHALTSRDTGSHKKTWSTHKCSF